MKPSASPVPCVASTASTAALKKHEGLVRQVVTACSAGLSQRQRYLYLQDLRQEALLALCTALSLYDPAKGSLASLATSCMRSRVLDEARRLRRHDVATQALTTPAADECSSAEVPITSLDPDQHERVYGAVSEDCRYAVEIGPPVRKFLALLPAQDRQLVEALYWRDETQSDVAARRRVSRAAVSKALRRVLSAGRAELKDYQVA